MKTTLFILAAILIPEIAFPQIDCSITSVGYIPINDLGKGISAQTNKMGGLYPNGSNYLPAAHKAAGLSLASQVQCLDANGTPDAVNGKIVWLSIGLSNTTQESQVFIPLANAFSGKNPKLTLIDGAVGSHTARAWSTPSDPKYAAWDTVNLRLANAGVTAKQVQVIWFKQANSSGGVPVQEYYDSLVVQFKRIMKEIKVRFPNAKLCYLSSRIYAGYALGNLNPEPYSYWTGWADKQIIEDQINGDPQLAYSGTAASSPWLSWGPYLWADGTTPRSDGLTWVCPTDFQNDGTHPSATGELKVAQLLLDFFSKDSTTRSWFMGQGCNLASGITENKVSDLASVSPNPSNGSFTIELSSSFSGKAGVEIYNSLGQKIFAAEKEPTDQRTISLSELQLPEGVYFLRTCFGKEMFQEKIVINDRAN